MTPTDVFIRGWFAGCPPYHPPQWNPHTYQTATAIYNAATTAMQRLRHTLADNPAGPPECFLIAPVIGTQITTEHLHDGHTSSMCAVRNPHLLRGQGRVDIGRLLAKTPVIAQLAPDHVEADPFATTEQGSAFVTSSRVVRIVVANWLAPVRQQLSARYATEFEIAPSSVAPLALALALAGGSKP
ncbi:hypothetical protein AB0I34_06915 [Kribbella sp. NPDC050281]|uniref:hypothetical protein n=1 Tax=Kribbella sp. NPDC050281 TaxID=3155515 RepID=UPI0033FF3028